MAVYDPNGRQHTLSLYYRRTADGSYASTDGSGAVTNLPVSQYEVLGSIDGKRLVADTANPGKFVVSESTDVAFDNLRTLQFYKGENVDAMLKDPATGEPLGKTTVDLSFSYVSVTDAPGVMAFSLNMTGTTNYASAFEVQPTVQDGYPIGSLAGITFDDTGKLRPLDVKAGDRILFGKYSGSEIKIDGEEHLILREDDILGVLES